MYVQTTSQKPTSHIKTTHSHQQGVNTWQERRGPEPKERLLWQLWDLHRHSGVWGPRAASLHWLLSWAQQQQQQEGQRQRQRRAVAEGLGWGQSLGSYGRDREALEEIGLGPRGAGSVEDFQLSQVRLGCSSLEGRVTEDGTADLSELTLHQAAIIGKQAPGKKKPKIIYQPS